MSGRRAALAIAAVALALGALSSVASARPVRVGRYTEIPYGVPSEPWVTGGGGPKRAGRSRHAAPMSEPTLAWEARLQASRAAAPLLTADGELFVSSSTGVSAIGSDGAVRWSQRLGFVAATPSLTPSRDIVVGTNAGALFTLSRDGSIIARTIVGGAVRSSPLVLADGSVVVTAFDQAVHRFDAEGRRVFRVAMNGQTSQPAAFTPDGTLLAPAAEWLHVMSPRGERIASYTVGAAIVAGPAVADDGTIWLLARDGSLHRLEPGGGSRLRVDLGVAVGPTHGIAVGSDGAVRVAAREMLLCIGPGGAERFRITTEGGFQGGVTLDSSDVTLAVSDIGRLIAVSSSGEILWRVALGARSAVAPVLGPDGTIYVATARGTIRAYR